MTLITQLLRPQDVGICRFRPIQIVLMALLFTIAYSIAGDTVNCLASQSERPDRNLPNQDLTAVPTLSQGDLYAVVVGISQYKNPAVPSLRGAANDAKSFADFLETQRDLFADIGIELLTDELATKANIEKKLTDIIRRAGKNDTIVLFLSGHGSVDPKRPSQFFFLTHDSDPDALEASSVNMSGMVFLKNLECPRVVLIADTCHSGGLLEGRAKSRLNPLKTLARDLGSSAGKVVITSSRPDEYSLESRYRESGVFTHWFLEGLKGAADKEGRGVVTINEAYNYAYEQTKVETHESQHPQFQGNIEGIFPLSITANVRGRIPTILDITADPPGSEIIVGGLLKGGANRDGSFRLKYLPIARPIPVVIRKEGWVKQEVAPPVEFSEKNTHVTVPLLRLDCAVSSLGITTTPGDVAVTLDGRAVGKTDVKGNLIINNVQVSVNHIIELEKAGFYKESINLVVPVGYESKTAQLEGIPLRKVSTSRPVDRIGKDYVVHKEQKVPNWKTKRLENLSSQDQRLMELNPGMTQFKLENVKQIYRKRRNKDLGTKIYLQEMRRDMFKSSGHGKSQSGSGMPYSGD